MKPIRPTIVEGVTQFEPLQALSLVAQTVAVISKNDEALMSQCELILQGKLSDSVRDAVANDLSPLYVFTGKDGNPSISNTWRDIPL